MPYNVTITVNEERIIRGAVAKSNRGHIICKSFVRGLWSLWSLFEPIKRFLEKTNLVWKWRITKANGLMHGYSLIEINVKEGIYNVELMNRPSLNPKP